MGRCKQADHCTNPAWCKTTGKCLKAEPMRTQCPLPTPHLHAEALAVMNAGWERGGHVYSADQMRSYAAQQVEVERERFVDALADACIAAEIPDSKFESLMIALRA